VAPRPLILVVEDNPSNQMLFEAVLDGAGYEVLIAGTAAEAREHLKTKVPALILMDVNLPGEDGLTLTRWLKFMHETEAIPVVALTASGRLRDREAAMKSGCIGFISKPIDVRTFASRVAQYLEGPSVHPAT
jgi:two-component system, cell cycle response regulator DivK